VTGSLDLRGDPSRGSAVAIAFAWLVAAVALFAAVYQVRAILDEIEQGTPPIPVLVTRFRRIGFGLVGLVTGHFLFRAAAARWANGEFRNLDLALWPQPLTQDWWLLGTGFMLLILSSSLAGISRRAAGHTTDIA
jgi:hypothetical protein